MKNKIIGLFLLLIAGLILFQDFIKNHIMVDLPISIWGIIWVFVFAFFAVNQFKKHKFIDGSFLALVSFLIVNRYYKFIDFKEDLNLKFSTILFVVFLAYFALKIIFNKDNVITFKYSNKYKIKKESNHLEYESTDIVFSSATKYINTPFQYLSSDVVFSTCSFYFSDEAIINDSAVFNGDVVFSSLKIFIPRNWEVVFTGDKVFSMGKIPNNNYPKNKTLTISGNVVFANLEVHYIN